MTIAVIVVTRDPHRQDEALRAALGLTMRGAAVEVVLADAIALTTPIARRAADTLRAFGHVVGAGDLAATLARADAVEVWT